MRRSFSGVTALMVVLALAQFARGANDNGWVGRRVIIKRGEVRPQIGKQPTGDPLRSIFTVEQVQGEWLWVGEGWLRSSDVVPVKDAAAWFERELQKRPTAFAYLGRGLARDDMGDVDGALADFTASLRLEPRSQRAYRGRAVAYFEKREMVLALNDLQTAIDMGATSALLLSTRGAVRSEMRDYRGALDDLTQALQMDPRDADAYSNRGAVHVKLGKLKHALTDLNRAVSLAPRNPQAYANRGWILVLEHRYDESLKDFDEAVRLDPNFVRVRVNRGDSWALQGKLDRAITEYDEAIRLDPKFDAAWRRRAAAQRRSGNLPQAARDVNQAIRIAPNESENYCERARLDDVCVDYQAMLKDATKATELDPRNETAFECKACAHSLLGDVAGSIADFSRAIELTPNNGKRYLQRAQMLIALAEYRKALADFDAAVRLLPREALPLVYRAMTHAALGNFEPARQDIAAALRLDPENAFNAYGILAQVSAHEAGDAQAIVALQRALPDATRSQQAAIYSQLALILAAYPDDAIRDGQQALAAGKKACELSDGRSFWALVGLAAAHAECGDFAAAVDCQQKALALPISTDPSIAMSSEPIPGDVMKEMRRRLTLYQSGQPSRMKHGFGSKIGSRVIARSPEMKLQVGNRPVGEALGETVLVVERVRGDWLWVGRGWIRTDDVVPVEDASVGYMNRLIRFINQPAPVARSSDLKRALDDSDAALRLSPNDAYLYGLRASIRRMQGDDDGARLDLRKMIEVSPQDAATMLMNLGFAAQQRDDYSYAVELYLRVFGTRNLPSRHKAWTHLQLAEIWAECSNERFRDGRRAVDAATKACELTNWKSPEALTVLASGYAQCGDFRQAAQWQAKAIELPPTERRDQPLGRLAAEMEQSRLQELKDRLASYRAGKRFESPRRTILVRATRVEWR